MHKMTIVNRSKFPDPMLTTLVGWVAEQIGLTWECKIEFANVRNPSLRAGMCYGSRHCRIRFPVNFNSRGKWPYRETYHRYSWAPVYLYNNRLECLTHLVAHEMIHCVDARKGLWSRPKTRHDHVAGMEVETERRANAIVLKLREEFQVVKRKISAAMRRQRAAARRTKDRGRIRRASIKNSPEAKLARARANLAAWERRLKLAQTKVKKYRRRVGYYERRGVIASAASSPSS